MCEVHLTAEHTCATEKGYVHAYVRMFKEVMHEKHKPFESVPWSSTSVTEAKVPQRVIKQI